MRESGEELRSKDQPASCEWREESLIESFSLFCALPGKTSFPWWFGSNIIETGSKTKEETETQKLGWRR